jgi:P27 family predicted phage terminase small subunit
LGRPRKPTQSLERSGQFREDRHGGRKQGPKFAGEPALPTGLSADAKKHWELVVPALVASGVATAVDGPALEAMCALWGELQAARRIKIPAWDMQGKRQRQMMIASALREWRNLAARFGLTPADRARIEVGPNEEKNPFEEFMRRQTGQASNN